MPGMTFSFDDIQEMADERSDIRPWGYEEYLRDENGGWYLDHLLIIKGNLATTVYMDDRPSRTHAIGGDNV
jgi:hypothetical protein